MMTDDNAAAAAAGDIVALVMLRQNGRCTLLI